MDPQQRDRILQAAAELFTQFGVLQVNRRDIAESAGVPMRSMSALGERRSDFLREVVERLPRSPVAESLKRQANDPSSSSAMATILAAAHDALGDPTAAWDPIELQALTSAPFDESLRGLIGARLETRWDAVREVLHQLGIGKGAAEEAAVLHVLAVGVGIAVLSPLIPQAHDTKAWTALAARLLESLASEPVVDVHPFDKPRVWRARVSVVNAPSAVAQLTRMLSLLDVSVVSMTTAAASKETSLVDLLLRSRHDVTRSMVVDALSTVGEDVVVGRGQDSDADDVAARVLELSTRLLAHPEYAPQAAAELLLADSWQVVDASLGEDSTPHAARLQWTVDQHVIVRRESAPFTAGEYARASALLELLDAVTVAHGTSEFGWRDTLLDGTEIITRLARPEDTTHVEALHARCSPESLYQRYFMPKNSWREENLRKISGGHRGVTLVVTTEDDSVIAIGNAFPLDPSDASEGEVALLVEDAWHGRGIGRLLLAHLVEASPRLGFQTIVAFVLEDNRGMQALLDPQSWTAAPAPDLGPGAQAFRRPID